jgi:hypothetical protein
MSGGGGGVGGGGPPSTPKIDCSRLIFRTTLNSPKPAVVRNLKKDQVLEVEAKGPRGPVVVKTRAGEEAGSITSDQLLSLLECIAEGFSYVAVVRSISGGQVDVEIRPRSK